mgnify:CR=1 FL=1
MAKKGIIAEIFSKAKFADESQSYKIFYRNFERIVEKLAGYAIEKKKRLEERKVFKI